jgi:hypothetical protein
MLIRIRDPESFLPEIRVEKKFRSGIRNKHPGSATLLKKFDSTRIQIRMDPHWFGPLVHSQPYGGWIISGIRFLFAF